MFRRDVKLRQLDDGAQRLELRDADRIQAAARTHAPAARTRLAHAVPPPNTPPRRRRTRRRIKAYYDAHKSEYMTPETVNLRYVEMSLAELAKPR